MTSHKKPRPFGWGFFWAKWEAEPKAGISVYFSVSDFGLSQQAMLAALKFVVGGFGAVVLRGVVGLRLPL